LKFLKQINPIFHQKRKDKMNTQIQEFITGKRIAVVGASRTNDKYKFGNMAATELKRRGYEVYFVHPQAESINGETVFPNLNALKGRVDGVLVSVPAAKGADVLRDAAAAGILNVWLQLGGESPELVKLGEELKLNLVTGKCILMYAQPVRGFHVIHRFVARVSGQL
jgi:predicted CoA-binding protein